MADTNFNAFSLQSVLQPSDLFLAYRAGGGINFTLGTLFSNLPATIITGLGLSTGTAGIEVGQLRTGDGVALVDLHATSGSDYEARIIRNAGINGLFNLTQTGAGEFQLSSLNSAVAIYTNGARRVTVGADGNVGIGVTPPSYPLHVATGAYFQRSASDSQGLEFLADGLGSYWIGRSSPSNAKPLVIHATTDGSNTSPSSGATDLKLLTLGIERLRCEQVSGAVRPGADNAQPLGTSGVRWSVVYAGTGTINTSDEREKVWRGTATEAETRAARRIIGELGFYQWKDAVEAKGADGARYHFGVRAQRVWAIMAEEGLVDPIQSHAPLDSGEDGRPGRTPYAFLCFDEWGDEFEDEMKTVVRKERVPVEDASLSILGADGRKARKVKYRTVEHEEQVPTGRRILVRPASNRYGVRPDQLTLFLMAGQEAAMAEQDVRMAALEARLAALEAAD